LILAYETFFLQLIVIILTFIEFWDPQELYNEAEPEFTPLKKVRAVMNIPEEEVIDEAHLLRLENSDYKYEIVLRKKALTGILNQVGHNFTSSKKGIDIGNEIPKVIKF
jgi:hypothetical protein